MRSENDRSVLVEDFTHSSEQLNQNETSNNDDYSSISNENSDNLYIDYEDENFNNVTQSKVYETEPFKK